MSFPKFAVEPLPFRMAGEASSSVERNWVVDGLGEAGNLIGIVGAPGSGKSSFAIEMARAVASGTPFFGRPAAEGAVLIWALERSRETDRRLAAMEPLQDKIAVCDTVLKLDDDAVRRIVATADAVAIRAGAPVRLVILDTFARLAEGLDENSVKEMSPLLRRLSTLASQTGAIVAVVHHTGHRGDNARGSSALLAAFDVQIVVKKDRGDRRTARLTKSNIGPEGAEFSFVLEPVALPGDEGTAVLAREFFGSGGEGSILAPDAHTCLSVLNGFQSAVNVKQWKERCYDSLRKRNDGARRQAFSSAKRTLLKKGLIEILNEVVSIRTHQSPSDSLLSDTGENCQQSPP